MGRGCGPKAIAAKLSGPFSRATVVVLRERVQAWLWVSESEYRFSGLLMRLAGLLMPGSFRKQSLQIMQDFKAFAEQGKDVRDMKG